MSVFSFTGASFRIGIGCCRSRSTPATNNALLSHTNGNLERSQSATIGDTYTFGPNTLNTFHATFTRLRNNRVVPNGYNAVDLGVNMYNYDPSGMLLSVTGDFSTGASPGIFNRNTFQEADDVDLIRGKHQIAFGVYVIRTQNNLLSAFNRNGNFSFNGEYTNDPMLDFLLGRMSDFQQSRAQVNVYRETILGLYIQHSFKASEHLLFNAGLRWEPMLFPQDYFGRGNSFSMAAFLANRHSTVYPNAPAGLLFYGDPGIPKAFTNDKYLNLSPRLGLVWNPHGDGRDTFRIGAGILDDSAEVYYAERLTTNAPYMRNFDLNSPSYDEKYIMRDVTGALSSGFTSEGGFSQEVCPLEGVQLMHRNMSYYMRALHPNLIYLDTIGGLPLVECYDPRHPLTRAQSEQARLEIMRQVTDAGDVLGAEGPPQDWNVKAVDFYDEGAPRFGLDVPLWSLVYHDCVMLYRQHSTPYDYGLDNYGYVRGGPWPIKFLRSLVYGDQSSWTMSNDMYWAWRKTFKEINDVLAPAQRRVAFDEMTNHQILTPDYKVQRTTFSSGIEVTVNYGEFPFKLEDGSELPELGYRVRDAAKGGHTVCGRVNVQLVTTEPGKSRG